MIEHNHHDMVFLSHPLQPFYSADCEACVGEKDQKVHSKMTRENCPPGTLWFDVKETLGFGFYKGDLWVLEARQAISGRVDVWNKIQQDVIISWPDLKKDYNDQ